MPLPPSLQENLEAVLGGRISAVEIVAGGMINHTARVRLDVDWVFVKWNEAAPAGLYAAEAAGLNALRATETVLIPEVLAYQDADAAEMPYLVLEWLEPFSPHDAGAFSREFAAQLAALHAAKAGSSFGWAEDNFLGNFRQVNSWLDNWPEFYLRNRLLPHIELGRQLGHLPPQRMALLRKVCDALEQILDSMETRTSLIHGDLWSGNFMSTAQGTALLDPAVYYGPREVELAYIELFGGFPPDFATHYRQISPLPEGYEQRRPVHQLYHLLVHLNHFGEEYGPPVDRACVAALSHGIR